MTKHEQLKEAIFFGKLTDVIQLVSEDKSILEKKDLFSPLHYAVSCKSLPIVKFLVKQELDINDDSLNDVSYDQSTPLMVAARMGNLPIVNYLLEQKAKVNKISHRKTALIYAAKFERGDWDFLEINSPKTTAKIDGYYECAKSLVLHGANLNVQDEDGFTALMHTRRFSKIFDLLHEYHADLNIRDKQGQTFLMQLFNKSFIKSNLKVIKKLILAGADVNIIDNNGNSCLDLILNSSASESLKNKMIKALFTSPKIKFDSNLKLATLTKALSAGLTEQVKILYDNGVMADNNDYHAKLSLAYAEGHFDIAYAALNLNEIRKKSDCSPLLIRAIKDRKFEIAAKLIKLSNVNYKDKNGKSPLQLAISNRHTELMKQLIAAGADVNEEDTNGYSLLMNNLSKHESKIAIATLLINSGANLAAVSKKYGTTVLIEAANQHNDVMLNLILQKYPLNINATNNEGQTALMITVFNGVNDKDYKKSVIALVNAGADPYIRWEHVKPINVFDIGLNSSITGPTLLAYKKKLEAKALATAKTLPIVPAPSTSATVTEAAPTPLPSLPTSHPSSTQLTLSTLGLFKQRPCDVENRLPEETSIQTKTSRRM